MSDDSGDFSDNDPRPSGSRNRSRNNVNQKRKRRIVMRIEFDDSDEDSSASSASARSNDADEMPSCSTATRCRRRQQRTTSRNSLSQDSANTSRLRTRRSNICYQDGSSSNNSIDSDGSNGKEKSRRGKSRGEMSETENSSQTKNAVVCDPTTAPNNTSTEKTDDCGFTSDSSSNELLEKCPICLLTFRQQQIGSPSTCNHIFCANCIEAWSKNVQTCPIDRLEFTKIIVRSSYENREIVREINIDSAKSSKQLVLDEEEFVDEEDVTQCEICSRTDREDVMLLCDSCNEGYHIDCLTPPLTEIPEGSWYCDNCFDSQDENENEDIDLSVLYEDIRDMGIPETRLRIREVQQPRILRTRQNERIRAAILRRTRSNVSRIAELAATAAATAETQLRRRTRNSENAAPAVSTTRARRTAATTTKRRVASRRRRRRTARHRTYVVEYDLNNFDEKFALKTTKKVIRRRRRKHRAVSRRSRRSSINATNERMTASKRLAEQMGVKRDTNGTLHHAGAGAGLSLFGNANDLDYFSDDNENDDGGLGDNVHMETGHGTAVQTAVRMSSIGALRSRKSLLLAKVRNDVSIASSTPDILSSIMDMQERFNTRTDLSNVRRNADGSLIFQQETRSSVSNSNSRDETKTKSPTKTKNESISSSKPTKKDNTEPKTATSTTGSGSNEITQAPMYSRGGGNQNFNGSGGYNSNRFNNPNRNGNAGGGNNYSRHSTGGMNAGSSSSGTGGGQSGNYNNLSGLGNFNFSSPNYSTNQNQNQNQNFTPFNLRFNQQQRDQQNNQNNNNHRNSLPFLNRSNDNDNMRQQTNSDFSQPPQQQPRLNPFQPTMPQQPQPILMQPAPIENMYSALRPPPLAQQTTQPIVQPPNVHRDPPLFGQHLLVPPPVQGSPIVGRPVTMPGFMSVPPPPAPPIGVRMPWNTSLFKLGTDYANNEEEEGTCPNLSVYSATSQEVARGENVQRIQHTLMPELQEDDGYADLVQLDDDQVEEEIPMPPAKHENAESSDLYEPENPTEEMDESDEHNNAENIEADDSPIALDDAEDEKISDSPEQSENVDDKEEISEKTQEQEVKEDTNDGKESRDDDEQQYDPEEEVSQSNSAISSNVDTDKLSTVVNENGENDEHDNVNQTVANELVEKNLEEEEDTQNNRSPSPAASDLKLPESEASVANRKGVLELYDDSDWEELEIDKPKAYEKVVINLKEGEVIKPTPQPDTVSEDNEINEAVAEPDRSYTPCLDENNELDDVVDGAATPDIAASNVSSNSKPDEEVGDQATPTNENVATIAGMETELISDDDENSRDKMKQRHDRRDRHDKENYGFKKVGNRQKERNYRTEKQPGDDRHKRSRRTRSRSRSHSRLRSFSRSFSKSRQRSRSKRRTRSLSRARSLGSRSPRQRSRSSRSRKQGRSRSRSKDYANWRQQGGRRFGMQVQQRWVQRGRPKRREILRYDVRSVIGQQRNFKDRYGRDARPDRSRSRSNERRAKSFSRSRSGSPKRNRRSSFSMSPSPEPTAISHRRSISPRRFHSPPRNRSIHRRSHSIGRRMKSRSISPVHRLNGRNVIRHIRNEQPHLDRLSRSRSGLRSFSMSPRYTPNMSRSLSKSLDRDKRGKKKKSKDHKKKKAKKRSEHMTPEPARRISRQQDPFDIDKPPKKKRRMIAQNKSPIADWSPSPSPTPLMEYERPHDNVSWTPPIQSPRRDMDTYPPSLRRSVSIANSKKDKKKRAKKKKKMEKRRDGRKDKRRTRRTETPEPLPSKEVFASGNNILVSVSFNKDATNQPSQQQQTTVVTLPPNRDDIMSRRMSNERHTNTSGSKKKKDKTHKRKKIDAKPVAIIDLERSPFQIQQEPTDVIILTDSEDPNESDHHRHHQHHHLEHRRLSDSVAKDMQHHRNQSSSARATPEKSPPNERLDTILEESYDIPQTGPKTPPEPPTVKFNLLPKKSSKLRNPLHDDTELNSDTELEEHQEQEQHIQESHHIEQLLVQSNQKIGPNTPPESGPCSPDVYDPFEPTKSPSMSPRSPTPPPLDISQGSLVDSADDIPTQKFLAEDQQRLSNERGSQQMPAPAVSMPVQPAVMNPVDLVMALMNSKTNNTQDLANKSSDSQFSTSSHTLNSSGMGNSTISEGITIREKTSEEVNGITVISNVLISTMSQQSSQHIPSISSPTPPMTKNTPIMKLPLPNIKVSGSVGSSSGAGLPSVAGSIQRNGGDPDDSLNINDIESPYSPGSADYDDLFDPPPDTNNSKKRQKRGGGVKEVFDNLFGSSSPIGQPRLPSYTATKKRQGQTVGSKRTKAKGKADDFAKFDDLPNSAVDLQNKDKFLRKLNRQERVVEEVKLILKPRFNKKQITKDDYKEIMRRAVPKICHSRSGEINPNKIKNLIEAYVKKFRAKHKKLNIINTGQVSSAVKCAAYLKKL